MQNRAAGKKLGKSIWIEVEADFDSVSSHKSHIVIGNVMVRAIRQINSKRLERFCLKQFANLFGCNHLKIVIHESALSSQYSIPLNLGEAVLVPKKFVQKHWVAIKLPPMHFELPTKNPGAVQREVEAASLEMFPVENQEFVSRSFQRAFDCFTGKYPGYQAIDARYHDLEHTLQGTLCLARLLLGRHRAHATPALTRKGWELSLLAILLHDTGYLKRREDLEGTGAKYTVTHVARSADFARALLREKYFPNEDIEAVCHMISCTGVDAKLKEIPFQNELERILGFALATADLVGQMAAPDYVEKLPVLYSEFAEATKFSPRPAPFIATFRSAEDLMNQTPSFWEKVILPKLENDFGGLHSFLNEPYPAGPNEYLRRIEANIRRLKDRLRASAA
jgi:hypothetical protein